MSRCEHPTGHPIFEREVARQDTSPPNVEISADDVVHMIYTSGTTSNPKGVLMTNRALIYGAEVFVRGSGLSETRIDTSSRCLFFMPLHTATPFGPLWFVVPASLCLRDLVPPDSLG